MNSKKHLLFAFKILIILFASFYIISKVWQNFSALKQISFHINNIFLLIIAFMLYMLFFMIKVCNWHWILKQFNKSIPFTDSAKIWFGSQTIKYIPGKIWFLLGRFYLANKLLTYPMIFLASFIEILLMLISGTLIFLIFGKFFEWINLPLYLQSEYFILLMLVGAVVAIHPFFLQIYQNILSRLFKQSKEKIRLNFIFLLILLPVYGINWLLFGFASYLVIVSFFKLAISYLTQVIGIFAISYVIGFLSFLTPGGIGVRESVQVYFLAKMIPDPITALVAIISRIFWISCELLGAGIFVGLKRLLAFRKSTAFENRVRLSEEVT